MFYGQSAERPNIPNWSLILTLGWLLEAFAHFERTRNLSCRIGSL
jgi:hypothetical protein